MDNRVQLIESCGCSYCDLKVTHSAEDCSNLRRALLEGRDSGDGWPNAEHLDELRALLDHRRRGELVSTEEANLASRP